MFKKLLLSSCLILAIPSMSFANSDRTGDDVLAGVQQLTEDQMRDVTGEDITIVIVYPQTHEPIELTITPSDTLGGLIVINGETGEVINYNVYPL